MRLTVGTVQYLVLVLITAYFSYTGLPHWNFVRNIYLIKNQTWVSLKTIYNAL